MNIIEEAIIVPLQETIRRLLSSEIDRQEEILLVQKMEYMSNFPQDFFHIPTKLQSKKKWGEAVSILSKIGEKVLPSQKLDTLLLSVRGIYVEHMCRSKEEGVVPEPLTGDDFLPIFCYIICQSKIKQPLTLKNLLWALCHNDVLRGEGGYYITVFEASLEYVKEQELIDPEYIESRILTRGLMPVSPSSMMNRLSALQQMTKQSLSIPTTRESSSDASHIITEKWAES